jgi:hypothetical protein
MGRFLRWRIGEGSPDIMGTGEKNNRSGTKLALLPGTLILIYQGMRQITLIQNHLVLQVGGSCIVKKHEMLKKN